MFKEIYYPGAVMILSIFIAAIMVLVLILKAFDAKKLLTVQNFIANFIKNFLPKSDTKRMLLFVLLGFVFINAFVFATPFNLGDSKISDERMGYLGSFLSGYVGSLFGLVSVVLLYLTLSAQRKANKEQTEAREKENFLTRYYTLLDLHRKNVEEIRIKHYSGRIVFVRLVEELRYILQVINKLKDAEGKCYSETTKMQIAYVTLLYGVDEHCVRMLEKALGTYCNNDYIKKLISQLQTARREENLPLHEHVSSIGKTFFEELGYLPFDGHQSRLSHYFRHIYQMIKYIDQSNLLNDNDKQDYVKTIRAQLSIYEQAIFCLNIMTNTGKKWDDMQEADGVNKELWNYVEKYKIIKNLPTTFFDPQTELDIKNAFPKVVFES